MMSIFCRFEAYLILIVQLVLKLQSYCYYHYKIVLYIKKVVTRFDVVESSFAT